MRYSSTLNLLTIVLFAVSIAHQNAEATLKDRLIFRRQSENGAAAEGESTTISSNQGQQTGLNQPQPPRLYPDLPQVPGAFAPQSPDYRPRYEGQTPFVPFGMHLPPNRFNDPTQFRAPMPRPMSSAERVQSQTFVSGLGRRLLSMIGVQSPTNETTAIEGSPAQQRSVAEENMKALQNATVLQQLNRGVQSVYGSLSKMYNSTVQQQLDLLQEQFKKVAENSTNPWQQRMSQQVPQFFKSMAMKVEEAQSNLNRIFRQVTQANNGSLETGPNGRQQQQQNPPPRSFFNSFDQFMNNEPNDGGMFQSGNFFNQIGRSFGFGDTAAPDGRQDFSGQQPRDFRTQLMDFWHNQVQPQIGMVRGQIERVWRDLTVSGAYSPDMMMRVRNNMATGKSENVSSDTVDQILKAVDLEGSEFSLLEPKSDQQNSSQQSVPMTPQMQNGLMNVQRKLNQLWFGLTNSLQDAIANVRTTMNPQPNLMVAANKQEVDPAENEISGKIKDLSKLQKDADTVYDVVQQQQQAQQRRGGGFGDRFRSFFNNFDLSNLEQLPNRLSAQFSRPSAQDM